MLARWLKYSVAAAVVTAGLFAGGKAMASDPYCPPTYVLKKVICYETVVSHETRCETYKEWVLKYDHCNQPYHVYETRHRYVQVPVKKVVAVTKYVKVPAY